MSYEHKDSLLLREIEALRPKHVNALAVIRGQIRDLLQLRDSHLGALERLDEATSSIRSYHDWRNRAANAADRKHQRICGRFARNCLQTAERSVEHYKLHELEVGR